MKRDAAHEQTQAAARETELEDLRRQLAEANAQLLATQQDRHRILTERDAEKKRADVFEAKSRSLETHIKELPDVLLDLRRERDEAIRQRDIFGKAYNEERVNGVDLAKQLVDLMTQNKDLAAKLAELKDSGQAALPVIEKLQRLHEQVHGEGGLRAEIASLKEQAQNGFYGRLAAKATERAEKAESALAEEQRKREGAEKALAGLADYSAFERCYRGGHNDGTHLIAFQQGMKTVCGTAKQAIARTSAPESKKSIFDGVEAVPNTCGGKGYFLIAADQAVWDVPVVRRDCRGCPDCIPATNKAQGEAELERIIREHICDGDCAARRQCRYQKPKQEQAAKMCEVCKFICQAGLVLAIGDAEDCPCLTEDGGCPSCAMCHGTGRAKEPAQESTASVDPSLSKKVEGLSGHKMDAEKSESSVGPTSSYVPTVPQISPEQMAELSAEGLANRREIERQAKAMTGGVVSSSYVARLEKLTTEARNEADSERDCELEISTEFVGIWECKAHGIEFVGKKSGEVWCPVGKLAERIYRLFEPVAALDDAGEKSNG